MTDVGKKKPECPVEVHAVGEVLAPENLLEQAWVADDHHFGQRFEGRSHVHSNHWAVLLMKPIEGVPDVKKTVQMAFQEMCRRARDSIKGQNITTITAATTTATTSKAMVMKRLLK